MRPARSELPSLSIRKQMYALREAFMAVNFDASLLDSLFGTDVVDLYNSSVAVSRTDSENQSLDLINATTTALASSSSPVATSASTSNNFTAPTVTLNSMLNFLNMNPASIPQDYLDMTPAKKALNCLMEDHNYLYDSLMQAVSMTLSRHASKVYSDYIGEISSSIEELEGRLDCAIRILTQINQNSSYGYCDDKGQELNEDE